MTEHIPTEETKRKVTAMAQYGVPHDQICAMIGVDGICLDDLYRFYSNDLKRGAGTASYNIGRTLYKKAVEDGDVPALIWWTKAQMRWERVNKPNKPQQLELNLVQLSDEELIERIKREARNK